MRTIVRPAASSRARYACLVLVPLPEDEVAVRGVEVRLLELAARDGQRQRRQVRAGEMRREVGRRESECVVENAHTTSIGPRAAVPYEATASPLRGVVRPATSCLAWLDRDARGDPDDPSRRPGTPARLHHVPRTRLSRRRHERPGGRARPDYHPRDGDPQHHRERHDGDVREGGRRPGDRRAERELRVRAGQLDQGAAAPLHARPGRGGRGQLHRPGDALRGPEHELPERRRRARHRGHGRLGREDDARLGQPRHAGAVRALGALPRDDQRVRDGDRADADAVLELRRLRLRAWRGWTATR